MTGATAVHSVLCDALCEDIVHIMATRGPAMHGKICMLLDFYSVVIHRHHCCNGCCTSNIAHTFMLLADEFGRSKFLIGSDTLLRIYKETGVPHGVLPVVVTLATTGSQADADEAVRQAACELALHLKQAKVQ